MGPAMNVSESNGLIPKSSVVSIRLMSRKRTVPPMMLAD